jgi:hypothetical protein
MNGPLNGTKQTHKFQLGRQRRPEKLTEHHPDEVEGSEPSQKFTESHGIKSGNVAYEMDSTVAELPAHVPGSSDTKHVYRKQGAEDATITVGTRLNNEKQITLSLTSKKYT